MSTAEAVETDRRLVIRRSLPATPSEVFDAFTRPEIMREWYGPGDVTCVGVESDPRVGGRYRVHMRSAEGDHVVSGEYLELVPGERVVFSWSWESGTVTDSRVTVDLRPAGDRTELTLTHERLPSRDAAERHTQGWNGCLDNLVRLEEGT